MQVADLRPRRQAAGFCIVLTGWEFRRVAAVFAELMERLGYDRYGVQGGDWGAAVSRELGRTRPDRVIGVHLNLLPNSAATQEPSVDDLAPLGPAERKRTLASWQRHQEWSRERQGYADIQSTRPQTLAYALTDSPVGQLAWIAEKFKEWTDSRDRPEDAVDRDQMLTNVMLYWLTGTAGSSARIYYERAHADYWARHPNPRRRRPRWPTSRTTTSSPAARRGADEQHRAVDAVRARRALRCHGAAGTAGSRWLGCGPADRCECLDGVLGQELGHEELAQGGLFDQ